MLLHAQCVHQRKDICIQRTIANCELLVPQYPVSHMRPVLFRLRAIEPECIPALLEELPRQVLPIELPRLWIRRIVYVRVLNVEVIRLDGPEVIRLRIEQTPDRNHGMKVIVMQRLQFLRHIRKVRVEDWVAFGLPPEPILHDRIQGDMLLAIAFCDTEYLRLRFVPVLRLE